MVRFFVIIVLILAIVSCNEQKKDGPSADIVLINGKIWTGESDTSFREAMAISGNKIIATGTGEEIKKLIGEKTNLIDLKKQLVLPGFNDAHIHFLSGAKILSSIDLLSTTSLRQMKSVIAEFVKNNPSKQWFTGRGWQYGFFDGGLPSKSNLDSLVSDRPMFIRAYDGHTGLANSKALELAKITRNSKYAGFGEIVKDAKGEPTGVLLEGAQSLISNSIPKATTEENLAALRNCMKYAASLGITSVQNANGDLDEYNLYRTLLTNNEMTLRLSMGFSVGPETTDKDIAGFIAIKQEKGQPQWLKGHAIKFMLDGVIESHTAVMLEPYSDIPLTDKRQQKHYAIPLEDYRKRVLQLDHEGFQLYTHAIGNGAVRETLNAYEMAKKQNGNRGQRHRIEHIEQVHKDDITRFAALGVLPSMQPIHADPGTVDVWGNAVGKERMPFSFAWQSFLKSGATLVYGSDWPACISANPIRGIHSAVNRQTINGHPPGGWVPEQRISVAEAIKSYTVNGAFASFDEKEKGKLAPGFLADLVVLSQDLFIIASTEIFKTEVLRTFVDGKEVFAKEGIVKR